MIFGLNEQKPHHYLEMARVAWQNRDELPFAWRILRDGVCDGCALGTSGLQDWTLPGTHLCMVRLELLRLNTAPALDPSRLEDVSTLRTLTAAQLRELGRLPEPMLRRAGDRGFRVITWDDALAVAGDGLRQTSPERMAFYLTSRGITNEVYYAAQKVARFLGSENVDNSARLCHAASTFAMKGMLGHGASTCSYADWLEADLIVLFGANTPNNQPVTTKYLHVAKERGTRIAVVNTHREPGLRRYWVPSVMKSAVLGTRLADDWFDVHTGGDLGFLVGVLKALIELNAIDHRFIEEQTVGWDVARAAALATNWPQLEEESGATEATMRAFAQLLADRPKAIFVWSMGLTQHAHGVDTVRALLNIGLARGLIGRAGAGLVPIRGHSGVQGGAEVGCVPGPGGLTAVAMIEAAARGEIDAFWMVGGNFLETVPRRDLVQRALERPRLRIHHDIVLSSAMLVDPADTVLVLPAATRYESPGGGTETSTERRIIFSPEIPGRRCGSARPEWWALTEAAARAHPGRAADIRFESAAAIRDEIGRSVPLYRGIEKLSAKGDQIQWGGRRLYEDGRYATPDGKAHFVAATPAGRTREPGTFYLSTRRGKQFNSMVQRGRDPLTGADRDAVLMCRSDAESLRIRNGDRVRLTSASGSYDGRLLVAPMRPGNLEVHWPEGNVLLGSQVDPESLEPDYNAVVRVLPLTPR